MPVISKLETVLHETLQGEYRTRRPQDIADALQRKVDGLLTSSDIDKAAAALPNIFGGNQSKLREGAHLENPTWYEKIDRQIPLIDLKLIPKVAGAIGIGAIAWHMATYGADPSSIYYSFIQSINSATPEWASHTLNAVNEMLYFFKGRSYLNAAIIGFVPTIALGYGLFKGFLPGRGDQIKWKKSYFADLEEKINIGMQPVPYVGHIVGFGMRDPLASAEMEDGSSFIRHLRAEFENVVLIQRDTEYWRSKNQGLEFNLQTIKKKEYNLFVNLPALLDEGTPLPEALSPIIISGAYQAGGIIINGQREFELFEDTIVDTVNDKGRLNFALGAYLVRNANLVRNLIFEDAPPLRVSVVVPQYLSPKEGFKREGDSWKYVVQANFLTPGAPSIDGVIVPEQVFLGMVYDILSKRQALQKTIYIDTEGENDARGKAERCKNELRILYESRGVASEDIPEIITDPERAGDAQVSIFLRGRNRYTGQSVAINRFEHKHDLVLYASTQREKTIARQNPIESQTRVPIFYKSRIAELIKGHLTGQENEWSLNSLISTGTLRRYT